MTKSDDDIVISFCIPTYNRAEYVKRSVMSILEIDSPHIEVVVVNNNSQDDTETTIRSIQDDRISYYKNENNIGAVLNIIETIKKAKGEWIFLLSDEDIVVKNNIMDLIEDLSKGNHSEAAVIFGNIRMPNDSYYLKFNNFKYSSGDDAIKNLGFSHGYMSGIIINKFCICNINLYDLNIETVGVYPHIYIFTYAFLNGNAITVNKDFVLMAEPRAEQSYIEKPGGNIFPHPTNRLKQFKIFVKTASKIVNDKNTKIIIMSDIYMNFLNASTYGWEISIKSESSRLHYGIREDTYFNFWSELKNFDAEAKQYFDEVITEPEIRKNLDEIITKKLLVFKLGRLLGPVRKPILWSLKKIKKPIIN